MLKATKTPNTEHERARYLGQVALYFFCVSSVAMPSSSWYKIEASLGACPFDPNAALLKSLRNVGIEAKNTNKRTVRLAMEEGFGEGSMKKNGNYKSV